MNKIQANSDLFLPTGRIFQHNNRLQHPKQAFFRVYPARLNLAKKATTFIQTTKRHTYPLVIYTITRESSPAEKARDKPGYGACVA